MPSAIKATGTAWEAEVKLRRQSFIRVQPEVRPAVEREAAQAEHEHEQELARISHCEANGTVETLRDDLSVLTRNPAQEAGLWLLPVDDDRSQGGERPGLHDGMTISCYLRLVDASSRMIRAGKASLEAEMAPIFERLGLDQHMLESTVSKLFEPGGRISNRLGRIPERVDADQVRSGTKARGERRLPTQQLIC
jgi:hypothetical protein